MKWIILNPISRLSINLPSLLSPPSLHIFTILPFLFSNSRSILHFIPLLALLKGGSFYSCSIQSRDPNVSLPSPIPRISRYPRYPDTPSIPLDTHWDPLDLLAYRSPSDGVRSSLVEDSPPDSCGSFWIWSNRLFSV